MKKYVFLLLTLFLLSNYPATQNYSYGYYYTKPTPTPIRKPTPTPIKKVIPTPTPVKKFIPTPTPIPIKTIVTIRVPLIATPIPTPIEEGYTYEEQTFLLPFPSNHAVIILEGTYEELYIKLPNVTGWLDTTKNYTGYGTPTNDGEACRDGGGISRTNFHVTFGSNTTALSNNQVLLKFKLKSGQSIQKVNIYDKEPINTTFSRDNYSESNRYTFEGMLYEKLRTMTFDQLLKVAEYMFSL